MEQWKKKFIDFMGTVGEYDDLCFAIVTGKRDQRIADEIVDYIKANNINTFGMWEEDSGEKYDKYEKFCFVVLRMRKKYGLDYM